VFNILVNPEIPQPTSTPSIYGAVEHQVLSYIARSITENGILETLRFTEIIRTLPHVHKAAWKLNHTYFYIHVRATLIYTRFRIRRLHDYITSLDRSFSIRNQDDSDQSDPLVISMAIPPIARSQPLLGGPRSIGIAIRID
jgi:hypothetical protein